MRTLLALLMSLALPAALVGCGDSTTAPADKPALKAGDLPGPGVPTEGPEALKTPKKK